MVSSLLPCAPPGLSRIAGRCIIGETPWAQPWTPVLTLPHVRDGLRVLLMAVWCTFRRLSMCRPVHHQLTRNELLDLTTIVPATACQQRNYVETYSRFMRGCPDRNCADTTYAFWHLNASVFLPLHRGRLCHRGHANVIPGLCRIFRVQEESADRALHGDGTAPIRKLLE